MADVSYINTTELAQCYIYLLNDDGNVGLLLSFLRAVKYVQSVIFFIVLCMCTTHAVFSCELGQKCHIRCYASSELRVTTGVAYIVLTCKGSRCG